MDCAELAERRHTAELQRQGVMRPELVTPPPVSLYVQALEERAGGVLALQSGEEDVATGGGGGANGGSVMPRRPPPSVAPQARRGGGGGVPLPKKLPEDVQV